MNVLTCCRAVGSCQRWSSLSALPRPEDGPGGRSSLCGPVALMSAGDVSLDRPVDFNAVSIDVADSEIVAGRIIFGIKTPREHLGCSLCPVLEDCVRGWALPWRDSDLRVPGMLTAVPWCSPPVAARSGTQGARCLPGLFVDPSGSQGTREEHPVTFWWQVVPEVPVPPRRRSDPGLQGFQEPVQRRVLPLLAVGCAIGTKTRQEGAEGLAIADVIVRRQGARHDCDHKGRTRAFVGLGPLASRPRGGRTWPWGVREHGA